MNEPSSPKKTNNRLREQLYDIIFGTETPAGKLFDIVLIYFIILSVGLLMLDSVAGVRLRLGEYMGYLEWFFTIVFTMEYITRVYCSPNRWSYIRSFYGVIDLLSTLPSYLSLFIPGANYLLIFRLLRVLRIFRVLKLVRYLTEANSLIRTMYQIRRKIIVFFFVVLNLAVIFGSLMFIVEGPDNGFTSIPKSIYWTIVTITTVGYGDITPHTILGQIIASLAMLTGYSIIAVPTGIFTAELAHEMSRERNLIFCPNCGKQGHDKIAHYCDRCGSKVNHYHE